MTDRTSDTRPAALREAAEALANEAAATVTEPRRFLNDADRQHALGVAVATVRTALRLPAPDPAPVREALREAAQAVFDSRGRGTYSNDRITVSGSTLDALRAALAARPAPSATIPDEDLPGYRQPFTGPLGSRGDPTVALSGPSGDADAAWERFAADLTIWHRAEGGPVERLINHWRPIIDAALRAVAPSDGAEPSDVPGGRSARYWTERYRPALVNDPTYHSTVTAKEADEAEHALRPFEEAAAVAPSDGAGGLDVEREAGS